MKQPTMDPRQEQPPHYKIYVKMMKTIALDVKCTDTVDQIKSKISAIEGIDKNQQALFFSGNHLENDNTLADHNIMTNSSVDLYVTDGLQISVKIPSVGKVMKLNVKKSHSVADVKAVIEEKGGVPLDEQILMYAGRQLEDHQLLSQCGLSNGQTLHVLVCPTDKMRISVDVDCERSVNLDVKFWYTVADVKLMLETLVGLPACKQILGRTQPGGVEALEDTETLQNLHIRNNDMLTLYQNVQFFIKTYEGKTLTVSMTTCDTTDGVMKKIEEKLHIKQGVYYLQYRGRVLSLGDTIQKYKVENNSTVDMRFRNSHVVKQKKNKS
uniref:Ubiquitin-like domain-containing protein n=1 Tax=Arundo donax TaxID=35708 RepID=A0A0A8ZN82_ARUDO